MAKKTTEKENKIEPKLGENIILVPIATVETVHNKKYLQIYLPTTAEQINDLYRVHMDHSIILTQKEHVALNALCRWDERFKNQAGCEVRCHYLDRDDDYPYNNMVKDLLKRMIEIRKKEFC